MYVVIVCANCGGSSQVEEGALGQVVTCPLCSQPTTARTPMAVLPVAKPVTVPTDAPLSLDDAPQLPPLPGAPPRQPAARRSPVRTALSATLSLLLTLVLMGLIYGAFRYGSGEIPNSAWKTFAPPAGQCTIDLPGEPTVEEIPAEGLAGLGGKRFVVKRWFERVEVGFGWLDYEADKLQGATFNQLIMPFCESEMKRLGGRLTAENSVQFVVGKRKFECRLFHMDTDQGKALLQIYFDTDPERLRYQIKVVSEPRPMSVFAPLSWGGMWLPIEVPVEIRQRVIDPGERLRLYFAIVKGKKITAETKWVSRFLNSFVPE